MDERQRDHHEQEKKEERSITEYVQACRRQEEPRCHLAVVLVAREHLHVVLVQFRYGPSQVVLALGGVGRALLDGSEHPQHVVAGLVVVAVPVR